MQNSKLAIAIAIVSILYILVMGFLVWRYVLASQELSKKMKECEEEKKRQKELEEQALQEIDPDMEPL